MPEKSANVLVSRDLLTSNASILWVCNRCSGRYDQILQANAEAPFGGLAGEKMVNVLEVNLELRKHYEAPK